MCYKKKRKEKKNCCHLNYCCARVCCVHSLSLVSVCVQRVLSLYISLSLSLLQHKSSSVFVSSAVLLLLFSNFNHERKRKLTWWIYKFSPSLLTFVCIFFVENIQCTHHTHTFTHSYTHTPHTSIYCGTHCMLSLFVVILLHATFAPHSFYLLIRLRLELSLSRPPCLYLSISLSPSPTPCSARANVLLCTQI